MTRLRHTFGVSDLVAYRQSPSVRLHSVSPSVGNDGDSEKKTADYRDARRIRLRPDPPRKGANIGRTRQHNVAYRENAASAVQKRLN